MDVFVLGLFGMSLLACILLDASILYALAAGFAMFILYGRSRGFGWRALGDMALSGIKTVKNILITFVLIGMLTALWRGAGTIPAIVSHAAGLIRPSLFLMMAFLLNCVVSILTGTAFGTAATMGVICATMGVTMRLDPALVGGAILSGVYFGDRCSPVSTSALLVAELTKTDIFQNIRGMLRTAAVPFAATCGVYFGAGLLAGGTGEIPDLRAVFGREFVLNWIPLLPAGVILLLSLLQVNVKRAMTASILVSLPICVLVQQIPLTELPMLLLTGYRAVDPEIAVMLNGGGIRSMLKVAAIVCLSASYSGIFQKTGLLDRTRRGIGALAERSTPYTAALCTAVIAGMIACNQTLTIMLTHQLCGQVEPDNKKLALTLENTAVLVAPLVPWSIAGAVPLASVGAPAAGILFACFLYLLPLWQLVAETVEERRVLKRENDLMQKRLDAVYRAAFGAEDDGKT